MVWTACYLQKDCLATLMTDLLQSLLSAFSHMKNSIAGWLPFHSRPSEVNDPVADKLKDFKFGEQEDEETVRRQVAGQVASQDALAKTVYNARPQNPFSKDF